MPILLTELDVYVYSERDITNSALRLISKRHQFLDVYY